MKYQIAYSGQKEKNSMKEAFGRVIAQMGEDPGFVYLDADLMSSIGTKKWADAHPEQAYNVGVAEANMIGLAAGLSASGLKPLVHSFGPFASRRAFDQAFLAVGYSRNNVVIIGSDAGVTAAYNGGTHMPFEDMALYRTVPGATVIDITDSVMLANLLPKLLELPGLKYVRFGRKEVIGVYAEGSDFAVGQAAIIREGTDVVIFACGIMVAEAIMAAQLLEKAGISAAVIDLFSVKPLDTATVIAYARKTGAVVTAENHNVIGGLGSAVADVLVRHHPVPAAMIGIQDEFGEVGPQDYLQERFGLTAGNIAAQARAVLLRKNDIDKQRRSERC